MAALGVNKSLNDLELLQEIDQFCVAFEEAWSDGLEPDLADFLGSFSGESRERTLQELLWIEWDYLRRSGDAPRLDDYLARFPEALEVVKDAWQVDQKRLAASDPTAAPRGNRYRIIKPHARGGLGQVYVANDEQVGRQVALKEITRGHAHDPNAQERLLREARITGRLEHPGIVPVFSVGQNQDDTPYYTMRFVHGVSLREAIGRFFAKYFPSNHPRANQGTTANASDSAAVNDTSRSGLGGTLRAGLPQAEKPTAVKPSTGQQAKSPLPAEAYRSVEFRQLLARFAFVCHVVEYAHQHGVIHRDIKPSNIMLGKHDETLVVDWGLAKEMGAGNADDQTVDSGLMAASSRSDFTTHGATLGTPAYMSPEQAAGILDAVGPASDIFSLGATLFHLLTGASPYLHEKTADLRRRSTDDGTPQAKKQQPAVPPPLDAICAQALAHRAEDRYGSAEALARDIENWLADEAVSSYAAPVSSRLGRWARRHRSLVRSSVVAVVLLTLSLAATALLTILHNQELSLAKNDAEDKRVTAENERDISKATADFMVEWLRSPNPDIDGRTITVAENLDRAFTDMKANVELAPAIKLRLLTTLAVSYFQLGMADRAVEVAEYGTQQPGFKALDQEQQIDLRQWLALARSDSGDVQRAVDELEELAEESVAFFGPEHYRAFDMAGHLAKTYTRAGRGKEAVKIAQTTLELGRQALGETHETTLDAKFALAHALALLCRFEEAIKLNEEVLNAWREKHGPDHTATLVAQNGLATLYRRSGRHDEGIALHQQTLASRTQRLGATHPYTLNTQGLLANSYLVAGRHEEAIALHQQTFEARTAQLGSDHRNTLHSLENLGMAHREAGRVSEAIPLLQQAYDARLRLNGADAVETATSLGLLGTALAMDGQVQKAIPLLEQSLQIAINVSGDGLESTHTKRSNLAIAYRRAGRNKEAIAIYREVLAFLTERLGFTHPEVLTAQQNLAVALAYEWELDEATTVFADMLRVSNEHLGPTHPLTISATMSLATCFQRMNQPEKVVPLLEAVERPVEELLGWHHPNTIHWYVVLAWGYQGVNRDQEVRAVYESMVPKLEASLGKEHLQTLNAISHLATYLGDIGEYDEAIAAMKRVLQGYRQHYGADDPRTLGVEGGVGHLFRQADRFAEAEDVYQRVLTVEQQGAAKANMLVWLGSCQIELEKFELAISALSESYEIRLRLTPESWKTANAESLLGEAFAGAGNLEEAERHLAPSFALLNSRADKIPPSVQEEIIRKAGERVIRWCEGLNKQELAEQWRKKLATSLAKLATPVNDDIE